jgi:hypothetical protein
LGEFKGEFFSPLALRRTGRKRGDVVELVSEPDEKGRFTGSLFRGQGRSRIPDQLSYQLLGCLKAINFQIVVC